MTEMVERVARAICECSGQSWESAGDGYREICADFARAAIEAMRDPTLAMEISGDATWDHHTPNALEIWQAMIDTALDRRTA